MEGVNLCNKYEIPYSVPYPWGVMEYDNGDELKLFTDGSAELYGKKYRETYRPVELSPHEVLVYTTEHKDKWIDDN